VASWYKLFYICFCFQIVPDPSNRKKLWARKCSCFSCASCIQLDFLKCTNQADNKYLLFIVEAKTSGPAEGTLSMHKQQTDPRLFVASIVKKGDFISASLNNFDESCFVLVTKKLASVGKEGLRCSTTGKDFDFGPKVLEGLKLVANADPCKFLAATAPTVIFNALLVKSAPLSYSKTLNNHSRIETVEIREI
jgi:hypothetical protein